MSAKIFLVAALTILITMPSPGMCVPETEYREAYDKFIENNTKHAHLVGTLLSSEEFILNKEFRTGEEEVAFKNHPVDSQVKEFEILLADAVVYLQEKSDKSYHPHFSRCLPKQKNCQKIHIDSQEKPEVLKTNRSDFDKSEEISRDGVSCQMITHQIDDKKNNVFFMCQSIEEPSHIMITHRIWESRSSVVNQDMPLSLYLIATPTDLAIADFFHLCNHEGKDLTFDSISFPFPTKNDLANWHHKES